MTIFIDLDGVIADFDGGYARLTGAVADKRVDNVDWNLVNAADRFFYRLKPLEDLKLWHYLKEKNPVVLSGAPRTVPHAMHDKHCWGTDWLGNHVPLITCQSKNKSLYCSPGDLLIDDWTKYQHLWINRGGVWITHTSADDTIRQLKEMGI